MVDCKCPACGRILKVPEQHVGKNGKCKHCGSLITAHPAAPQAPPQTASLIEKALRIINPRVSLTPVFHVSDTSKIMEAATLLGQASSAAPADPCIHYAYACALAFAAQFRTAEAELERLVTSHPNWHIAKYALEVWRDTGPLVALNLFALPEWPNDSRTLPSYYAGELGTTIYAVRAGIVPRAVQFERDTDRWWTRGKLAGVRFDIAVATSSRFANAAAVYRWAEGPGLNEPDIQENIVILDLPKEFRPLVGWEYFICQDYLDIVVADSQSLVLHSSRVPLSADAKNALAQVAATLDRTRGRKQSNEDWMRVVVNYQNSTDLDAIERRYFRGK